MTLQFVLALDVSLLLTTWWLGGAPERVAVAILAVWGVADVTYGLAVRGPALPAHFDPYIATTDLLEFVAIAVLAMRANRVWPLFAAGAQLVCLGAHLAIAVLPLERGFTYFVMTQGTGYLQLFCPLAGAIAHHVRQRVYGSYPDWRPLAAC